MSTLSPTDVAELYQTVLTWTSDRGRARQLLERYLQGAQQREDLERRNGVSYVEAMCAAKGTDPYTCDVCGEPLIPLEDGFWACMDLSHGRLRPLDDRPHKKDCVQFAAGGGDQIRRGLRALDKADHNGTSRTRANGKDRLALEALQGLPRPQLVALAILKGIPSKAGRRLAFEAAGLGEYSEKNVFVAALKTAGLTP